MQRNKPSIFGAGLVALDLVVSADQNLPVNAWAGGSCGNILTILSYLGWDAYPIATLGAGAASERLRADLKCWGVHLNFSFEDSINSAPIIVQEIYKCRKGLPKHRFVWECPSCGHDLPRYQAVSSDKTDYIAQSMLGPNVFFVDRISKSNLKLARLAAQRGAVVVYEPSQRPTNDDLTEILCIAHIVKYSDERLSNLEITNKENSSILLEVQTLGRDGLRYHFNNQKGNKQWRYVSAFQAPRLTDTCGSGDWCTAGVISKVGYGGVKEFKSLSEDYILDALNYGQALAAWNCGFEGARGGMYSGDFETFHSQISNIINGHKCVREKKHYLTKAKPHGKVPCPSCARIDSSIANN